MEAGGGNLRGGAVRVIAGLARGRPLVAPQQALVRPTSDLVKGAIFSMLEAEAYERGHQPSAEYPFALALGWPRVLDIYAGSGALGIEALSRGAAGAHFVEPSRAGRLAIQENLRRTGLSHKAQVYPLAVERAVSTLPGPYDLILADPPYAELRVARFLGLLPRGWWMPSTVLVLEHAKALAAPEQSGFLRRVSTHAHGRTAFSLYVGELN